jgi:hypothetical protein
MRQDRLEFVLLALYLMVIGALLIKDAKPVAKKDKAPVAIEHKAPVAVQDKASVDNKPDDAGPQAVGSTSKPGLTPDCEKQLRHIADLLRFFANRIQMGEETQSVVADMRQQEKKISAVCE